MRQPHLLPPVVQPKSTRHLMGATQKQTATPVAARSLYVCKALCPSPRAMEVGYWLSVAHHKTRPVTAFTHSRRELLTELLAAPMLSTLWQQEAMPSADGAAGRMPTAAELGAVEAAFASTLPKIRAPTMLRLVFHDAGTYAAAEGDGGLNASIRFELERPENKGLKRGWSVIERTTELLKGTVAEGTVSQADLIALAGAYAVKITGGPAILVQIGRVDAQGADPTDRLPAETLSAQQLIDMFAAKGLIVQEMVALSGSHTIGGKGFGDPLTFDNTYFTSLLQRPWENTSDHAAAMIGLPSDHVLPNDETCMPFIQQYAANKDVFFRDFAAAYMRLTTLGVKWA